MDDATDRHKCWSLEKWAKFIESKKERKVQSVKELFDEVHRHDTLIDRPHTNFYAFILPPLCEYM